jgi:hypothetical protein
MFSDAQILVVFAEQMAELGPLYGSSVSGPTAQDVLPTVRNLFGFIWHELFRSPGPWWGLHLIYQCLTENVEA